MQNINLSTDANQTFRTTLGDQIVNIDMRWQDVSSSWFISVYNSDKMIINNKRVNANTFILANMPLRGFSGGIIAVSLTSPTAILGRNSFTDGEFYLLYMTNDEIKNGISTI